MSMFRQWVWITCLILAGISANVQASSPDSVLDEQSYANSHALTIATDLSPYGELARRSKVPVLVMFSTPGCDYCRRLEQEVLRPMKIAGVHPEQVLIVKVEVGSGRHLRDFDGANISADRLAERHRVMVYPTVVLVNGAGQTMVPNLVGYQSPDFYGAYLDNAIAASRELLASSLPNEK